MSKCPLCDGNAEIGPVEWSGARFPVQCPACGHYETNNHTVAKLAALRLENSPRIKSLQASIASSDVLLHITYSQTLAQIILESGPPRVRTKLDKKLRRRGTTVVGQIYQDRPEQPESDPDDA